MTTRRELLVALGALAVPLAGEAQQTAKPFRVVYLASASPESAGHLWEAFKRRLHELGYVEGKNAIFEARWALGKVEHIPGLAKELIALKPDAILVLTGIAARALQQETTTIPIVFATLGDPIGTGLIKSLARPGGNITGLSSLAADFSPKLLELLLMAVPKVSRVAVLSDPSNPAAQLKNIQTAAQTVGISLVVMEVQTAAGIENAFARIASENIRAAIVLASGLFMLQKRLLAELATRNRVPTIFMAREYPEAGGFMSYGSNYTDSVRDAASYVDRILKGARPGDLPVEQSSKFELVLNLKTARAIGLTVPQSLLLRADRVIE